MKESIVNNDKHSLSKSLSNILHPIENVNDKVLINKISLNK